MRTRDLAVIPMVWLLAAANGHAAEDSPRKVELKDGSTVCIDEWGYMRMVDAKGFVPSNPFYMRDGEQMVATDGPSLVMNPVPWMKGGTVTER